MPATVRITSDSTTDLGEKLLTRYDIPILPLNVTLGEMTYSDGVNISPDQIYEAYNESGQLPKTAAPNIANCLDFFRTCTEKGQSVVHFTISSDMSSSYSNACMAAQELDNVHVVDTRNLSAGGGLLVTAAAEMAARGMPAEEIARTCRELVPLVDASFVLDNLEFLCKGGRCSALAAFGANVLRLKPCIEVKDGKMGVAGKYRGKFDRVLLQYIHDRLRDPDAIDRRHVFITHAGCSEEVVRMCLDEVQRTAQFEEIHVTRAGCTISSHCGRNTLGVLFLRKKG